MIRQVIDAGLETLESEAVVWEKRTRILAESLSAEFWTADVRLVHAMERLGVDWVHEI